MAVLEHEGDLISGVVTCTCGGFETAHHVVDQDSIDEFMDHVRVEVERGESARAVSSLDLAGRRVS